MPPKTTRPPHPTPQALPPATAAECAQGVDIPLTTEGALTIGTGNPAYGPWYGGKSVPDSEWESSSVHGRPAHR